MNKTLILTAVTNSKDILSNPLIVFDNCDYIAFTDRKYNVSTWEQRSIYEFSNIDEFSNFKKIVTKATEKIDNLKIRYYCDINFHPEKNTHIFVYLKNTTLLDKLYNKLLHI